MQEIKYLMEYGKDKTSNKGHMAHGECATVFHIYEYYERV